MPAGPAGDRPGLLEVQTTETVVDQGQEQPLPLEQRAQVTYDAYILRPGDGLQIECSICPN